jgi:hypothetical protein
MDQQIAAKKDMQGIVDGIVSAGAVLFINPKNSDRNFRICVDRFEILLASPYTGKGYSTRHYYYWAVCYEVGFDKYGSQAVRIFKIEMVKECNPESLRFTDHHGNNCVLEAIDENDEKDCSIFRRWLVYKERNADDLTELYDEHKREAMDTVGYWESNI